MLIIIQAISICDTAIYKSQTNGTGRGIQSDKTADQRQIFG